MELPTKRELSFLDLTIFHSSTSMTKHTTEKETVFLPNVSAVITTQKSKALEPQVSTPLFFHEMTKDE